MMSGDRVDMKIVLLGMECSGKTSLVERYLHDRFLGENRYQNTIGAAFGARKVKVNDKVLTLGIWDTAGSERYEAMSRIYYRGAKAAIVCYDLTDRTSFDKARYWIKELNDNERDCSIYLSGTKLDLLDDDKNARQVDYHMTTDFAEEINAKVFETSSKTGEHIDALFDQIAEDFVESTRNNIVTKTNNYGIELGSNKGIKSCCGRA